MTKSPRKNVPDVGIELGAACMPSGYASDRGTAPGQVGFDWHEPSVLLDDIWPGGSVGCASAWHADGRGFNPRVRQHSFVEIGHEIISTAILSQPLIK